MFAIFKSDARSLAEIVLEFCADLEGRGVGMAPTDEGWTWHMHPDVWAAIEPRELALPNSLLDCPVVTDPDMSPRTAEIRSGDRAITFSKK